MYNIYVEKGCRNVEFYIKGNFFMYMKEEIWGIKCIVVVILYCKEEDIYVVGV